MNSGPYLQLNLISCEIVEAAGLGTLLVTYMAILAGIF